MPRHFLLSVIWHQVFAKPSCPKKSPSGEELEMSSHIQTKTKFGKVGQLSTNANMDCSDQIPICTKPKQKNCPFRVSFASDIQFVTANLLWGSAKCVSNQNCTFLLFINLHFHVGTVTLNDFCLHEQRLKIATAFANCAVLWGLLEGTDASELVFTNANNSLNPI